MMVYGERRKFAKVAVVAILLTVLCAFSQSAVPAFSQEISSRTVYLGGNVIGMSMDGDGLVYAGGGEVQTESGSISTTVESDLKLGDVIVGLNRIAVTDVAGLEKVLSGCRAGEKAELTLRRDGRELTTVVSPAYDVNTGKLQLGLWVRDHLSGIGTLTCSDEEGRFCALGHGVTEPLVHGIFPVGGGRVFPCEILGYRKSEGGKAGSIQGTFSYRAKPLGVISGNGGFGIFGSGYEGPRGEAVAVGKRSEVRPGRAEIVSNLDGTSKRYEIEIVKACKQRKPAEKGIVFRVKDRDLLDLTGGILQGMSGSPILQNGKFIGAVTHVFNNDSTKGYAIYSDWLIM